MNKGDFVGVSKIPGLVKFVRLALAAIFLFGIFCQPATAQSNYIQPDETNVALTSADWGVLRGLREHGDVRTKTRAVDHFLYPASKRNASRDGLIEAARTLKGVAKITKLKKGAIIIQVNSDTRAQTIAAQIEYLSKAAQKNGYDYNGWETMVVSN